MWQTDKLEQALATDERDGLADILLGLFLLIGGLGIWADMPWLVAILPPTMLPALQQARKTIKARRLRAGASAQPAGKGQRRAASIALGLGVVTLVLMVLATGLLAFSQREAGWLVWLGQNFELALGGILASLLALIGWIYPYRRLYLYALFSLGFFAIGRWLGLEFPVSLAGLGLLITLTGLTVLARFLRHLAVS